MTPARDRALLHACPGPRCKKKVRPAALACPSCWRQIPQALRDAIWAAWRNGDGAGTPDHRAATDAAIKKLRSM